MRRPGQTVDWCFPKAFDYPRPSTSLHSHPDCRARSSSRSWTTRESCPCLHGQSSGPNVERFDESAQSLDLVARAEEIGRTPYEVLIVASLVQAEVLPEDMRKAAAVVYNRLDDGMPLQFDSTVSYALGITELQLSAEQLETESEYNTYQNTGLPPTPINSPGEAALEAALDPAKAKWLYFVTVNPDTRETKFARDYDRFLKLKSQLQEYLAENG
ncbi:MAG: endolytic transglycosylase MltG [Actinobacteria bacterium]|nr:endolytic transglycosylase MltG [Actinomycetota bacterium]